MKHVAFCNGRIIPDVILENIVNLAKHGHATEAGKKLMLVPDRRKGPTDLYGLRAMGSVKKNECVALGKAFARYLKN